MQRMNNMKCKCTACIQCRTLRSLNQSYTNIGMLDTRRRLPVLISEVLYLSPEFLWLINTGHLIVLCYIHARVDSSAERNNKFQHVRSCAVSVPAVGSCCARGSVISHSRLLHAEKARREQARLLAATQIAQGDRFQPLIVLTLRAQYGIRHCATAARNSWAY